ncbi:MAG: ATP-binding protein [Firmicutes bacterium]|nr:ATP-binding protein [Bacillota bacterium]
MENLTVNAVVENLDEVVGFVFKRLAHYGCSKKTLMQIRLAVEEIFVNISSYAYDPSVGPAEVRCEVRQDPLRVIIQFLDGGKPFDPLAKEDADITADGLFSREGGLGILLVKETMDGVSYSYENGKNILTIEKKLAETEDACL